MSINCRVVDGEYVTYEEFVKLYNDYTIKTDDIKKIVGASAYLRLHKEALKNNDIKQRPYNLLFGGKPVKNYHFDKSVQKFRVRRVINGKSVSYGYFETEDEAKAMVEKCREYNWDREQMKKDGVL